MSTDMIEQPATDLQPRDIRDVLTRDDRHGIVVNHPRVDYMGIARLNPSSLAAGLLGVREIDPRAIRDAYQRQNEIEPPSRKDRMDRGTLAHLALLQPERLASDVAVWGGERRAGAAWDNFEDENDGKLIIRNEDYQSTMAAVNQMRSQKMVAQLLCDVEPEVAVFTQEGYGLVDTPIYCKGQLDAVCRARKVIVDIKTTEAGIDERSVQRTIREFHYREKMALYREWFASETKTSRDEWSCYNLFLGIGDRLGIRAVKFTTGAMEFGLFRMQAALTEVATCLAADSWPMFAKEDVMDVAVWECAEEGEVHIE